MEQLYSDGVINHISRGLFYRVSGFAERLRIQSRILNIVLTDGLDEQLYSRS